MKAKRLERAGDERAGCGWRGGPEAASADNDQSQKSGSTGALPGALGGAGKAEPHPEPPPRPFLPCVNPHAVSIKQPSPNTREHKNNQRANSSQSKANGRHAPLPMFFPGLILASRKALSKVLRDHITRTGQAAFEEHTESNGFPFKKWKTPKACVGPTCSEGHFPGLLARFGITIQWRELC